jgi:hypothetical protein
MHKSCMRLMRNLSNMDSTLNQYLNPHNHALKLRSQSLDPHIKAVHHTHPQSRVLAKTVFTQASLNVQSERHMFLQCTPIMPRMI